MKLCSAIGVATTDKTVKHDVPIRELSDFHRSIRSTREQSIMFVNHDLRNSLTNIFEYSMS